MPACPSTRGRARRGFAHLAVLIACLLLAVLAGQALLSQRALTASLTLARDQALVRHAADAGVRLAIAELAALPDPHDRFAAPRGWRSNGSGWERFFDDIQLDVQIIPEAGKLDINRAPLLRLEPLLRSVTDDPVQAAQLARAILDYRRRDGAAPDDAGAAPPPRGGLLLRMSTEVDPRAFDTLEELLAVPGMTRARFSRLAPLVTAHAARAGAASYTIRCTAQRADGTRFVRQAVVEVFATGQPAYVIHRWDQVAADQAGPPRRDGPPAAAAGFRR